MQTYAYYHHYTTRQNKKTRHNAVFAISLSSIPSWRLFFNEYKPNDDSLGNLFSSFVRALHTLKQELTYAIRIIIRPNRISVSQGMVTFNLLVKAISSTEEDAVDQIHSYQQELMALLGGLFRNYEWQAINGREKFLDIWQPINWDSADLVEIRRVEELIQLDRILYTSEMGFTPAREKRTARNSPEIYYCIPMTDSFSNLEKAINTCLLHDHPIIMTINLVPVCLSAAERKAMLDQIARCENPHFHKSSASMERIYKDQAEKLLQVLMEEFSALEVNPFLINISLASTHQLPDLIVNGIGGALTSSDRGQDRQEVFLNRVGFEIQRPTNEKEKEIIKKNNANLLTEPWGRSKAPKALQRKRFLFDHIKASHIFHFPTDTRDGSSPFPTHSFKVQQPPREIVKLADRPGEELCHLGSNDLFGQNQPIYISDEDRHQHVYVIGKTGTGKTTMLKSMILSDMRTGKGLAVIDPHGDLFNELLPQIPTHRIKEVVILNPIDLDRPFGLNLLECDNDQQRYYVVREMRAIMERLMLDMYGRKAQEYSGPNFYKHMQLNLMLAMSDLDHPGTLLQFYEIFNRRTYWKRWLPLKWGDAMLKSWVDSVLPHTDYPYRRNPQEISFGEYINAKFDDFVLDPHLRLIFGQSRSTLNLGEIMNEGRILLVNLSKGLLGEANANFLGMVLMAKIQSEVIQRASLPKEERRPFYLYVDEFQNLATENFTVMLSEARKFGLSMVLANQFLTQISNEKIIEAVFGNIGTLVSFRVGREDAERLEGLFAPYYNRLDLADLPNWQAVIKYGYKGQPMRPFVVKTAYSSKKGNERNARAVINISRERYGVERAAVEKQIEKDLEFNEPDES